MSSHRIEYNEYMSSLTCYSALCVREELSENLVDAGNEKVKSF
jgi:hypothetical protein